jgi:hypothetical protein
MVSDARTRATRNGLPFALRESDVHIPKRCPVLGIPLFPNARRAGPNSPSLDRLVPRLGYVAGNVIVVSQRANELRRDATVRELEKVARYYRRKLKQ